MNVFKISGLIGKYAGCIVSKFPFQSVKPAHSTSSIKGNYIVRYLSSYKQNKANYIPKEDTGRADTRDRMHTPNYVRKTTRKPRYDNTNQDYSDDEILTGQHDYTGSESLHALRVSKERDVKKHQNFIKKKIFERKYLKGTKEKNILSWSAKQQIKYLHSEFPDEWTVERLACSFPVDREAILKILKSNYNLTIQEQTRHDQRVEKNVESLSDRERDGCGIQRLSNVSGIPGIPSLPIPGVKARQNEHQPGRFESIILNYNRALEELDLTGLREQELRSLGDPLEHNNRDSAMTITSSVTHPLRSGLSTERASVGHGGGTLTTQLTRHQRRKERTVMSGSIDGSNLSDYAMKGTGKAAN